MAEGIFNSLLDNRISLNDIIEWLPSDVDEFKVDLNNAVCLKGEFVLYVLSILRQSFLSTYQQSTPSSKGLNQSAGEKAQKSSERSNNNAATAIQVRKTPNPVRDSPQLRREDKIGLSQTQSPQESSSEVHRTPVKSNETLHFKTLQSSNLSSPNDSYWVTPMQKKQISVEREQKFGNNDSSPGSPVEGRSRVNCRITLADFMKDSPNQKKRYTNGPSKGEKIATSTPSHDRTRIEHTSSPSSAEKNYKYQRRIKPTKILSCENENSGKNGFSKMETFGAFARSQAKSTFQTQTNADEPKGTLSFAEERSLLKDERLKLQNISNQSPSPKISSLPNTPLKTAVIKEVADPAKVTFKQRLILLCDLYSSMIDANLVPNLTSELHFVLSLLVVQRTCPSKADSVAVRSTAESISGDATNESSESSVFCDKGKMGVEADLKPHVIDSEQEKIDLHGIKVALSDISCEDGRVNPLEAMHSTQNSLTDTSKTVTPDQSGNDSSSSLLVENELSPARGVKAVKDNTIHLDTIHNCVFFATNLLWRQKQLLATLDRVTIKLLFDNERVAAFMPELALAVEDLYNKASPRTTAGQNLTATSVVLNCSTSENVTFHSERDNSTNFESSNAFRSFRKQRDAFYDIFQIWEADHLSPSWNFNAALKPRIRALLDMCRDATNYTHLARLFRMQLVSAVTGRKRLSDDLDSSFLECLRGVDREKLSRLRERLVTPYSQDGPRPAPQFPGQQEFFREFIMAVDNVAFIEHLKDNLISHLLELDQTDFCASDVEESDLVVDEETRQAFITCVTTMQLVAKFLGFIVFLPYQKCADVSRNIIDSEFAIRCKVGPPLNVMACVIDAWLNRRLVVTLPWVVQYLGMIDAGSIELPHYRNLMTLLLQLYSGLARKIGRGYPVAPEEMAPKTVMLLRLVLGWLFEMPCLPDGLLFLWNRTCNEQEHLQTISDSSLLKRPVLRENLSSVSWNSSIGTVSASPVDSLDLVDTSVVYAVCPFLLGLRGLLSTVQESNASAAGGAIRHITPVSTALTQKSEPVSTAQLELQLEETFFHGLPESVQKTIEFVVERVTSACIKQICNTLIPNLKDRGMAEFKAAIAEELKGKPNKQIEGKLIERRDLVVKQVVSEMRDKCNEDVEKICGERCKAALSALLSQVSLPPSVCEMCFSISSRLSTERVVAWFKTHATFKTYAAELQHELKKALGGWDATKETAPIQEKTSHVVTNLDRKHDDTAPSPADTLADLRELICAVLETHGEGITEEAVKSIVYNVGQTVDRRMDLTPAAERSFSALLLDLVVALVCHQPAIVTDAFIKDVITLWKNKALLPIDNSLSRIISPRNVMLLAQTSHPPEMVWNLLAKIVGATLCEDLVTADDIELQCLTILHQVWPQSLLVNFSSCVSEIVRIYHKKNVNVDAEKFVYLLNWLAEITKYMEDFPD